ncbi:antibiotic transporter [Mycobacterium sp. PS03-16]|uniref:ABC transporter permease n=1 Tax=Mycobacterium sp. PS03-16 TaxID=2559611 RepID=UPI001072FDA3|nr:ABC transporter permease [Mycobacterium sp. PS03-16]TFV57982.1 antibiotic transporter [Mycobacterium sp. PS03-16]
MTAALAAPRPHPSPVGQWWVLTNRLVSPTLRNGEVATALVASVVFTVGWYIPLNNILGPRSGMSSYAQFLMPLVALQGISFAAITGALRAATDSVKGINRRFDSMPIPTFTPVAARMSAGLYRCAVGTAAALISGHLIGFRFHAGVLNAIGFCVLLLMIGLVLSFLADLLGSSSKNPEATSQWLMLPQLIFGLISVGIQPAEHFPDWIEPIVRNQPISQFIYALRALGGDTTPGAGEVTWAVVGPSVLWLVGVMAVMVPLSVVLLRRRS